jgi:hypothetical protein
VFVQSSRYFVAGDDWDFCIVFGEADKVINKSLFRAQRPWYTLVWEKLKEWVPIL